MATYAIGDIQGCYQSFRKLLNEINFNPNSDKLLLAGDLINRGPKSLETMDFILTHQSSIQAVLGNHDLHFLAIANQCQTIQPKDTFSDILASDLCQPIVLVVESMPASPIQ
ncbi:MAG: metallophosphoesterase [Enterobacterales bacterium]|nr:metallophosphoesterase [Enterobacterales bacterium]